MQYSLYIRKQVNEKFKDEADKSKLVNTLLEGFYKQLDDGFGRLEGEPQEFKVAKARDFLVPANQKGSKPVVHKVESNEINVWEVDKALNEAKVPTEGRYVATPEGVFGPTKLEPKSPRVCKNGHPVPVGRFRCLGKACKWNTQDI